MDYMSKEKSKNMAVTMEQIIELLIEAMNEDLQLVPTYSYY